MKHRLLNLLVLSIILIASQRCAGQSFWLHDSLGFTEQFVQVNVAACDTMDYVASGYWGGIGQAVKSTDGGKTWDSTLNTGLAITCLIHPSRNLILLGGVYKSVGYVARSTDGGATWNMTPVGSSGSFAQYNAVGAITALDSTHIFLPIAGDHYLYSSDGGASWDSTTCPVSIHYNALGLSIANPIAAYPSTNTFIVAEADTFLNGNYGYKIFHSTDLGKTWNGGYQATHFLTKFAFINKDEGFASGFINDQNLNATETATIDKTTDGGLSWFNIYTKSFPTGSGLLSIAFADSLNGIAVGRNGLLIRTADGGTTWNQDSTDFSQGDLAILNDVAFPSPDHAIAVCRNGEALTFQPHGILSLPNITYPYYNPPSTPSSFDVTWNPVPGATRYSISVSTWPDSVIAQNAQLTTTSYSLNNLTDTSNGSSGCQYEISLQAFNSSSRSNIAHRTFIAYPGNSFVDFGSGPIWQYLYVQNYPNPAKNDFHVRLSGLYSNPTGRLTAEMDDLLGRKTMDLTELARQGNNGSYSDFDVDVSMLPAGVYMVRYTLGSYSYGKPVVIIH